MTRARDISKIVTDANLSGTLDVTGNLTVGDGSTTTVSNINTGNSYGVLMYKKSGVEEWRVGLNGSDNFVFRNTDSKNFLNIADNGDISFYEDTGTTPKLFWDASEERLGIGTVSPSVALDVTGGNSILSRAAFTRTDTSSTLEAGAWFTSGPYVGSATNHPLQIITNDTERMRIDTSGNVGIGTSSIPTTSVSHLKINTNTFLTDNTYTSLAHNAYWNSGWKYNTSNAATLYQIESDHVWYTAASGSAGGSIAFSERMRITSGGDVGIGTSSPSQKLSVAGNLSFPNQNSKIVFSAGNSSNNTIRAEDAGGFASAEIAFVGVASNQSTDITFSTGSSPGSENITEAMRINYSGNVGIGTTDVRGKLNIGSGTGGGYVPSGHELVFGTNNSDITFLSANDSASVDGTIGAWNTVYNFQNSKIVFDKPAPNLGQLQFFTNAGSGITERMRIDSSGNLLINTTLSATDVGIVLGNNGQTTMKRGTLGDVQFFVNSGSGTTVGKIQIGASSTSYITTSDHRLKENVTADWDATTRLKELNPVRFNFIADADTTVDGFLAHEVQLVVPEAISGTHNEVDADGNPVYQGIDQSKLVPLLVKTIQELEARIVALETA